MANGKWQISELRWRMQDARCQFPNAGGFTHDLVRSVGASPIIKLRKE